MAPPTDPEKDPLFRGLVLLLAITVVVMLGFGITLTYNELHCDLRPSAASMLV